MSDLASLRQEARKSMDSLVERSLFQDRVSSNKFKYMTYGLHYVHLALLCPMGIAFVYGIYEHSVLHDDYLLPLDNFLTRGFTDMRRIYAPQIYKKDARPYKISFN
jgi:hypothetical protein